MADTPQMGWNSWNKFGQNISEKLIREQADAGTPIVAAQPESLPAQAYKAVASALISQLAARPRASIALDTLGG